MWGRGLGPLGPLGPLGFERAQHRRTLCPSVDGTRSKALCPFGSQQRISRISSTVQTARDERLQGDPKVDHVKGYEKCPCSHAHQDPKSAFTRPIMVSNG